MFFFFKQKTAYEMRISDWSSDVCSSDLLIGRQHVHFLRAGEDAARRRHLAAGRDAYELAGEQGLIIVGARRAQRGIDALAPRRDDRGEPVFVGEAKPGGAVVFNRAAFIEVLVIDEIGRANV